MNFTDNGVKIDKLSLLERLFFEITDKGIYYKDMCINYSPGLNGPQFMRIHKNLTGEKTDVFISCEYFDLLIKELNGQIQS